MAGLQASIWKDGPTGLVTSDDFPEGVLLSADVNFEEIDAINYLALHARGKGTSGEIGRGLGGGDLV